MPYFTSIPHTTMVINFIGTAAVTLLPVFKGAVLAPLKRIRHFYGQPGLSDFYTPVKSMSGLIDRNLNAYLVYGKDINEAELPATVDYPGLTGPQQDFFDLDADSVKLAGDNVKWFADMSSMVEPYAGSGILPYIANMNSPLSRIGVGTVRSTSISAGTSGTHSVGVTQTLLLVFAKGGNLYSIHVDVSQLTTTPVNLRVNTDVRRDVFGDSTDLFGTTGVCNVSYDSSTDILTLALTAGDSGIASVAVKSLDQLTEVPYPSDPTITGRWFYIGLEISGSIANTLYQVLRGIQGYGSVVAGSMVADSNTNKHGFIKVSPSEDYENTWDILSPGITFQDLATAANPDVLKVLYPFYAFSSTTIYNVTPSLTPGNITLGISALGALLAEEHSTTGHKVFVCDAHVAYSAEFATSDQGNAYINRVYRSDASETSFPLNDGTYRWGLPHPDNPMGFGAGIISTFLGTTNYFYVVLADNKTKAHDLAAAMIPQILFITNLWEEYGQGGLNESGFLSGLATTRGDYPVLFTWMPMNPRVNKRGTETAYNAYPGATTENDFYFRKHPNDVSFLASPAVSVGDLIEIVYTDGNSQRAVITGVEASRVRISKKLSQTDAPSFVIYTRRTSSAAKDYYVSALPASNFNMFVSLNQGIQWGSSVISNKWIAAAIMAMKLVYPEQQALTGIGLDIGRFGVPYGGYDFFEKSDLDALVTNGYYILVSDPEAATGYAVRDVTAGLKSGDWRRGNGNAIVPVCTFAASCRAVLEALKGKYNKNSYTRNRVAMGLQAVETEYLETPQVPDFGPKLAYAKFAGLTSISGGYGVNVNCSPQEQANIFELQINVIFSEEEV